MDARESLQSAIDRFRTMAGQLGGFMSESEKVFLAAFTSLQKLEGEANRVLSESSSGAGMMSQGSNPAELLREGGSELDSHFEQDKTNTEKGVRALTQVLSGIDKLSCLDGDFQTIVASLHALASTTHLENSRLSMGRGGFDSVVSDLRGMALEMKPKFGDVLLQAREVRSTAQMALTEARAFLDHHRREISEIRRDTQTHLASMSEACQLSQTLADKAASGMSNVRSSVGRVLQSLQVQDLARQMFEHVVEGLNEFATAAKTVIDGQPAPPELRSWLAELAVVTKLESAQIANASDRLVSGLSQIDGSLQAIVSSLTTLAKESANSAGQGLHASVFAELERGIRRTTSTLRAHDMQTEAMMRALAKVSETATKAEALVAEVASLGKDARFIGLNAMVKAVRVGQAGATLTVLAREIQTVSDQIETFTRSASSIMQMVGREGRLLVKGRADDGAVAGPSGAQVASKLERLTGDLGNYQSTLARAVEVLLSGSDTLRFEVRATSDSLATLAKRAKSLRSLSTELSNLHNLAVVDARGAQPPPERQHAVNHRYTMEEERQIQRLALGGASEGSHERNGKSADTDSKEGSVEFF